MTRGGRPTYLPVIREMHAGGGATWRRISRVVLEDDGRAHGEAGPRR